MPVNKVPVVHKFGIISHSQRLELQERLLQQSYHQNYGTQKPIVATRNPLEVTEEFIQLFNSTESLNDREKLEDKAYKMLQRIKRRAGLKDNGQGAHVDLPVAWTELSQLAQCKGKIQEDCLDVLITSLDQAPIRKVHIPALFFLAETTLYWLRTDAVLQPFLRTGELKLLRMGQLVFLRLFFHHMAGQLQGHVEFKNRLFTYLDGFSECQEAYNPYPNALLSIRYINEVGKMVIGDCNTEAGEVKEGDNIIHNDNKGQMKKKKSPATGNCGNRHNDDHHSSHSGAISNSVHDLSPTLWHALDVWRCVRQLAGGLTSALQALSSCGMGLASESWIDGVCALVILADAAKADMQTLNTLQNLARGVTPPHHPPEPSYTPTHDMLQTEPGTGTFAFSPGDTYDQTTDLEDTSPQDGLEAERQPLMTETVTVEELPPVPEQQAATVFTSKDTSPNKHLLYQRKPSPQKRTTALSRSHDRSRNHTVTTSRHKTRESGFSLGTLGTTVNTGYRPEVGSDLDGRVSQTSSVPTYTNEARPDMGGLHSWHWEVAITYAEVLADIALHGSTSNIQKVALLGQRKNTERIETKASVPSFPMQSAGLLDLVFFRAVQESQDGGPNDWSWRVRYAALQGLVKLCRCCVADTTKEGLRTVAWNVLIRVHSLENDARVLEAFKVGQVDANIENLLNEHMKMASNAIGGKIAGGLSSLYLPTLPPPVDPPSPRRQHKIKTPKKQITQLPKGQPLRTTLREEIMLASALFEPVPDYNTRTTFDLHRMVEDQWRKELHKNLTQEEEGRQKELQEKQKQEEECEIQKMEKKKVKLRSRQGQICEPVSRPHQLSTVS